MRLRRALSAGCGLLLVAAALLAALTETIPWFEWILVLAAAAWLIVGAVLVDRRPGNAVGWLLLAFGVVAAVGMIGQALAGKTGRGFLIDALRWYGVLSWIPVFGLLIALLTVFPTGRPLARWHWLSIWCTAAFAVAATVWNGFTSATEEALGGRNPFLIEAVERLKDSPWLTAGGLLIIPAVVVAAVSLWERYRRAGSVERMQIKWLLVPAAALLPALGFNDATRQSPAAMVTLGIVIASVPVVIAIALSRYHLYDIDRIISRTVAYAIVGVMLVLVFVAAVGVPVLLLESDQTPSWLVAASTLVVFTLFNPLRRRVQRVVDRRFNRLPYDSERVTAALGGRMRDEMDPTRIVDAFVAASVLALQPSTAGAWTKGQS